MHIRPYTPDDFDALAAIYRDAVEALGPAVYTPEQVAVWAAYADEREAFRARLDEGYTLIAEVDGAPASFCQLHPEDHISLLYTAPQYPRQGLATAVYRAVESHARSLGQPVLTTDASKISKPFFEKEGYVAVQTEEAMRLGVRITRYQMEKSLGE